ncbi:MAG TPA: hypothetical protein DCZ94_17795 [Lentisphaeria bacterium]|nr:MAG: hypothetical protein A2X48_03655 [Lentisphaerae bacterium GWF2_49_21]HBC88799.1 hypothetical protein [Lentisphaeria bacterium]
MKDKRERQNIPGIQREPLEWNYRSSKKYSDPFNDVDLDVIVSAPDGDKYRIPCFWAGKNEWRARFAAPKPGSYQLESVCSDKINHSLHGKKAILKISPYKGKNLLLKHGNLRVADSKRTFEHEDGTPFFWLGDTWWLALSKRMSWPTDFKQLTADRVRKGFSVIQIVAGIYPDMDSFDKRGENEAGFPWEKNYSRINPAYFDKADQRIGWLVQQGLVPCIVGCWGYYLAKLGTEKLKKHWRYLIARWSAYPVVWCAAGEAEMPYYLSKDKDADRKTQHEGWTELVKYIRNTDPVKHMVTIHPTRIGRNQIADDSLLDFDMLQTGHSGYETVPYTVKTVIEERKRQPHMPVLVGEVNYEGIFHHSHEDVQRLTFWSALLSGTAGHTYGANGIWQVNTEKDPYGPSPHGGNWGITPWQEASRLPGSFQLGLARKFLSRYEWWKFEPRQDWVTPPGTPEKQDLPFAAGIPGVVRIIYIYNPPTPWAEPMMVSSLSTRIQYNAFFWDPRTGKKYEIEKIKPDSAGSWKIPIVPYFKDWVVVIEE